MIVGPRVLRMTQADPSSSGGDECQASTTLSEPLDKATTLLMAASAASTTASPSAVDDQPPSEAVTMRDPTTRTTDGERPESYAESITSTSELSLNGGAAGGDRTGGGVNEDNPPPTPAEKISMRQKKFSATRSHRDSLLISSAKSGSPLLFLVSLARLTLSLSLVSCRAGDVGLVVRIE